MTTLDQFGNNLNIVVIGATGGLGRAFVKAFENDNNVTQIFALSRSLTQFNSSKVTSLQLDIAAENQVKTVANQIKDHGPLDIVIVATGLLHDGNISPEKSARDITWDKLEHSFRVNTFGPALIAKHFLPLMRRDRKAVFAALSARVGSISDNRLGGWYAYRASKAALNMMLKTFAVEYARRHKHLTILGLHPGTVDTHLSEPFQRNVPEGKLFTPEYSASKLIELINLTSPQQSGSLVAWDGKTIPF